MPSRVSTIFVLRNPVETAGKSRKLFHRSYVVYNSDIIVSTFRTAGKIGIANHIIIV